MGFNLLRNSLNSGNCKNRDESSFSIYDRYIQNSTVYQIVNKDSAVSS